EYQYFVIPTRFAEDRWVQVMEVRPGNRSIVHHAAVFIRTPESKWMRNAKAGEAVSGRAGEAGQGLFDELLDFHVPGAIPHALPDGQAKLIPAGSDLVFQMHYTSSGKSGKDRTRVGFLFSKEPPTERVFTMIAANRGLVIPAGAASHPVATTVTIQENAKLVALYPHMHLRGKSFQFKAIYPTGESEVLLSVPDYKFYWQLQYYLEQEKALPPGTRIEVSGRFDNSPNNKFNPDASKEVRWGDQSWEEMLVGTMEMAIPAKMNPMELYRPKRRNGAE
ncbi:MAG: thiol-disulfide isomerase, partial [Bryobacteraceae bacterium]